MRKLEDRMSTTTRRSYTEPFKEEAVRLVRESEHPVAQVARDLGQFRLLDSEGLPGLPTHLGLLLLRSPPVEEMIGNTQLRRENAVLKQERDFLRRAAAFFAKESR